MPDNTSPDWRQSKPPAGKPKPAASQDWQGKSTEKTGPAAKPAGREADWKKQNKAEAGTTTATRLSKRGKIVLGLSGLAAAAGGIAFLIWLLYVPPPPLVVLVPADYADNLAVQHNVAGVKGGEAFADWAQKNAKLVNLSPKRDVLKSKDNGDIPWDAGLQRGPLEREPRFVVVYLALHGGADAKGAYLLPHNADPRDPNKFLRMDAVLDRLAQLSQDTKKLLILDATQVPAHPSLGLVHNDFVRNLRERVQAKKVPNLLVLSASDEGQQSWASEEWRKTIFAHYLVEGLKGAAGGKYSVNAWQLHQYVRREVAGWAWANREAVQTPVLIAAETGPNKVQELAESMTLGRDPGQPAYVPPDPKQAPGRPFEPKDLKDHEEHWRRCHELAGAVPPPEVYAPHLWRRYQALLVRCEELVRFGDTATAPALLKELTALEGQIGQAGRLRLTSTAYALPATLGGTVLTPAQKEERRRLLDASPEQQKKLWEEQLKTVPAGDSDQKARQVLAAQALQLALRRLDPEDAAPDLELAAGLIGLGYGTSGERPAEVNYRSLLKRDLDPKAPPALVRLALLTRQRAEETAFATGQPGPKSFHACSEQVYRWTEAAVRDADKARGLGQDYLIGSNAEAWKQAEQHLQKAKGGYEDALTTAVAVRQALQTRDEVLAYLPFYAQWLARRPTADATLVPLVLGSGDNVGLWAAVHQLDDLLHKGPGDKERLKRLTELRDKVHKDFTKLRDDFSDYYKPLMKVDVHQERWLEIQAALEVPQVPPKDRIALLVASREISDDLNAKPIRPVDESSLPAEDKAKVQQRIQRQGRFALHALGKEVFDQDDKTNLQRPAALANFDQVKAQLDNFVNDPSWQVTLIQAGEQLGYRWRRLPDEINRLTKDGRDLEDARAAATAFADAERLCRRVEGWSARLVTADPRSPVEESRDVRLRDFLLEQAERALKDDWWTENPGTPYYRLAGGAFVRDANDRDHHKRRAKDIGGLQTQLRGTNDYTPVALRKVPVTSHLRLPIDYRLRTAPGWKPQDESVSVVWVEVRQEAGQNVLELDTPRKGERLVRKADETKDVSSGLKVSLTDPKSAKPATVVLHGRYRGRVIEQEATVDFYAVPDTIVYQHRVPAAGEVAVRGEDLNYGHVVFVLDWSGSMDELTEDKETTKRQRAIKAMSEVLKTIPKATRVSVWLFGGQKIDQIFPLQDWDPQNPRLSQIDKVINTLMATPAAGQTPLLKAMVEAKADLRNAKGPRAMVVLTDGMDDRAKNPQNHKALTDDFKKAFEDSDIPINMVQFRAEAQEETWALDIFGKPMKDFETPGKLLTVKASGTLGAVLKDSVRPRVKFFDGTGGKLVLRGQQREDGLKVSLEEKGQWENLEWTSPSLAPGSYLARLYRLKQGVDLDPGDRLLLRLRSFPGTQELQWERAVIAKLKEHQDRPRRQDGPWLAAVLQNELIQATTPPSLQMTVTLEATDRLATPDGFLRQVKPSLVWYELQAAGEGAPRPVLLRVGNLVGRPAPAWSLDVPQWLAQKEGGSVINTPARPRLDVWWTETSLDRLVAHSFERPRGDFDKEEEFRETIAEDNKVELRVTLEEHQVLPEHGGPLTQKPVPCLVVRATHAPGRPILVRLRDVKVEGHEHRFYAEANSYTGIFWNVTKADAARGFRLDVIAIDEFKKKAQKARFDDRNPPDSRDTRDLNPPDSRDTRDRNPLLKLNPLKEP